jgi:kynurenine formamidase
VAAFVRLSHDIRADDPGWPGNPTYAWEQISSIADGDVANLGLLHLCNHFGSHLDAPNHFNPEGRRVAQVPIERFVYERPVLVDVHPEDGGLVTRADLEPHDGRIRECDLLLLRTGWSAVRPTDPRRYAEDGPGVSADACEYLISHPGLRAVALDFISLASYRRLDPEGVRAHQILCGVGRGDRYVIIVEDVDLSAYPEGAERVYAIPLFPEHADSSPCTVFAEVASGGRARGGGG